MTIEEKIEVMQAYKEGKVIEFCPRDKDGDWEDEDILEFNFTNYKYRIKAEDRPFNNYKECLQEMYKHSPFGWIKSNACAICIATVYDKSIEFSDGETNTFRDAFNDFTFLDGSVFGIKDENSGNN